MASTRNTILGLLFITISAISQAAEEFEDSIPLGVAEALFDLGAGEFVVYSEIMDGFPLIQIPDDFDVLGSTYYASAMRVALTTALAEEDAWESFSTMLLSNNWINFPSFAPPRLDRGFVSSTPFRTSNRQFCHDELGQLSFSFRTREPQNTITLHARNRFDINLQSCADQIAQQERMLMMSGRRTQGIAGYMPRIQLPEEARQGGRPALMVGGMSSSNNRAETDAAIEIDWDLEEVYQHFADQISEQDWMLDSESIGSLTATGTWTQVVNQNMNIVTRFNVVNSGDDRFDMEVTVEAPGGNVGAWIERSN
ncbi:MAG: hypothetical protein GKR91_10325 [Pseudomonadales bacterium]|nr:hypothetical protein [Pseudomonadales bacterium]